MMALIRPVEQIAGGVLTQIKKQLEMVYDVAAGLIKFQKIVQNSKNLFDKSDAILDIYKANKVEANRIA